LASELPTAATPPSVVNVPVNGLQVAIDNARLSGLTPLIVDRSEAHIIDTFHSYKADLVLDSKMHSL
jgi:hypothetical protein